MAEQRAQWGSRLGFILAAAGSAVGLGNIWKFPYITGENGGGLFVLIYLVCIALVGIPIMMAEIMIGRAAQRQPVAAFHALQGKGTRWAAVGWLGIVAGFIILSYYVVVAGWAMDYTLKSVVNFSAPIHAQAELEATEYLAKTDLGTMRDQLIQRRVERRSRDRTEQIRMQAPPSVWRGFDRFQTALERVEGSEEARQRLLTDPVSATTGRRGRSAADTHSADDDAGAGSGSGGVRRCAGGADPGRDRGDHPPIHHLREDAGRLPRASRPTDGRACSGQGSSG